MVRRVDKVSGNISTFAGTPSLAPNYGYSGDGGLATNAQIGLVASLAFDAIGNLYIADNRNHAIRLVNTSGYIVAVAGNGNQGFSGDGGLAINALLHFLTAVAVDSIGNLFISD